ncbi:FAD-linked oxidase C-terminal domain-containing protein [Myxococcota bacterium]
MLEVDGDARLCTEQATRIAACCDQASTGSCVLKAPYLPLEQPPGLIALQRQIEYAFDPQGWLNPGQIFGTD